MNIPEMAPTDKPQEGRGGLGGALRSISRDWVLGAIIALTASLFFGLGLVAAKENPAPGDSLWIEQLPPEEQGRAVATTSAEMLPSGGGPAAAAATIPVTGTYMASKSGSKYYLPSCSGAKRIKEENEVWFKTKEEAEKAGYGPAAGCKGI
jgi:hypothetical protein